MLHYFQFIAKNSDSPSMVEELPESGVTYIGYCRPGTTALTQERWIIKRVRTMPGNITEIMYADGSRQYNKAWTERGNYTYKFAV